MAQAAPILRVVYTDNGAAVICETPQQEGSLISVLSARNVVDSNFLGAASSPHSSGSFSRRGSTSPSRVLSPLPSSMDTSHCGTPLGRFRASTPQNTSANTLAGSTTQHSERESSGRKRRAVQGAIDMSGGQQALLHEAAALLGGVKRQRQEVLQQQQQQLQQLQRKYEQQQARQQEQAQQRQAQQQQQEQLQQLQQLLGSQQLSPAVIAALIQALSPSATPEQAQGQVQEQAKLHQPTTAAAPITPAALPVAVPAVPCAPSFTTPLVTSTVTVLPVLTVEGAVRALLVPQAGAAATPAPAVASMQVPATSQPRAQQAGITAVASAVPRDGQLHQQLRMLQPAGVCSGEREEAVANVSRLSKGCRGVDLDLKLGW